MPEVNTLPFAATLLNSDVLPLVRVVRGKQSPYQIAGSAFAAATGPVPSSTTVGGSTITAVINGVTVTTTLSPGSIVSVYGDPVDETWTTTIAGGSIVTVRTA
jgi:hypothetical protein